MPSLNPFRRRARTGVRYAGSTLMQPEPRRRFPWRGIATVTCSLAALSALGFGAVALLRSDLFRVQQVQVVGAKIVDPREIEAAAELHGDSLLLRLDTVGAERRISALPGVAQARVHLDWPSGVVVDVSERQGWGYWQVLGTRVVIDAHGVVVDKARPPAANAPTIYAVGATTPLESGAVVDRDTVALVTRLLSDGTFMRLGVQPQRFDFDKARGLVIHVQGAPAAVFGDSHDYEFKVAAWVAMHSRIKSDRIQASEIDLRFGKELVVR